MTAPTTPASHRAASRKEKTKEKKSFWSMEIGKKGPVDDGVDHPEFAATLPSVDLLPQAVRESIALHGVIRWFAVLLALIVLAGAGLWYLQGGRISEAEASLAQAQAEKQSIDKKIADLAPIKEMYTQIRGQQELVNTTLAAQPKATEVLLHLYEVAKTSTGPKGIQFSSASVMYGGIPKPGDESNLCPNPKPFTEGITVGCMTFEGSAIDRQHIAAFLTAMEADPMFVGPFVDSSTIALSGTGEGSRVAFTGTTGVSVDALEQPLTPEQIQAISNPPKADDTSSGGGS
jgi:hypothetical protein